VVAANVHAKDAIAVIIICMMIILMHIQWLVLFDLLDLRQKSSTSFSNKITTTSLPGRYVPTRCLALLAMEEHVPSILNFCLYCACN
jgi:hypothetical protein